MKNCILYALVSLALALAACSDDDPGTGKNVDPNNTATMDMGQPDDSGGGGGETDSGDEPDADVEDDMNTGEMDMAGADMGADMGDEIGEDMGGPTPYEWPATSADFITTADRVSYIWNFGVPDVVNNVPTCCRDFGAISETPGQVDNAFALLNSQLSGLGIGIDFQAALDEAIRDGDLVFLLDHRELDGADDADGFLLSWLDGEFAFGTFHGDASNGNGVFNVLDTSFVAGTGEPVRVMNRADMTASAMSGGPISINVLLPFGAAAIFVPIQEMNARADANITVDSVTYSQGELSGYILEDDIFDGLNTLANSPTCACLGLNGADLYTKSNDTWSGSCISDAATRCSNSSEYACTVIAGSDILGGGNGVCGLLPNIIQGAADIELSMPADSNPDALSIGLTWDAVNATIQ